MTLGRCPSRIFLWYPSQRGSRGTPPRVVILSWYPSQRGPFEVCCVGRHPDPRPESESVLTFSSAVSKTEPGTPAPYRGTSLIGNNPPLGPYSRPMPRVLGSWGVSYERGTPVIRQPCTDRGAPTLALALAAARRYQLSTENFLAMQFTARLLYYC